MSYTIYVEGSKYYYYADNIELVDVMWSDKEVVKITNPKECYDTGPYTDPDQCGLQGEMFIPKDKITHLIYWTYPTPPTK